MNSWGDSLLISNGQGVERFSYKKEWNIQTYNMYGIGNYFCFFSNTNDSISFSKNGMSWTTQKWTHPIKLDVRLYFSANKIYTISEDEIIITHENNGIWRDSTTLKVPGPITALFNADSGLFAISSGHVFFLPNNTKDWIQRDSKIYAQSASSIIPFKNLLYIANPAKFTYSYDGQNWKESFPPVSSKIQSIQVSNSAQFIFMHAFTADTSYLFKSANGIDWVDANITVYKRSDVMVTSSNQFVYLTVISNGYRNNTTRYFSADGGHSFKMDYDYGFWPRLLVATETTVLQRDNSLPLGPAGFFTTQNGIKWTQITPRINRFANLMGSRDYFYAWPDQYDTFYYKIPPVLLRSSDGEIWVEAKRQGLPQNYNFHSITAVNDLLFASLESGGLFMSKDFGDTWESIQSNLPKEIVGKIYMLDKELFIGTDNHGLWKASYSNLLSLGLNNEQFNQLILYPNPATNAINLQRIELDNDVFIYNINAQLVKVHNSSEQINIADLPAGLYFAKVQSGGKNLSGKFIKK